MSSSDIAETQNAFFGDQRVGQIYGDLANAAGESAAGGYRGENFAGIQTIVTDGLRLVESGGATAQGGWDSVVKNFEALGFDTAG
jgi:cellobiose transport system substrate-binding protein